MLVPQPPAPDALSTWGMLGLTAAMISAWVWACARQHPRHGFQAAGVFSSAVLACGVADAQGWLLRTDLRPPAVAALVASVWLGLGWLMCQRQSSQSLRLGQLLQRRTPVLVLVALQVFRLPLELLMLHAADTGVMPVAFSMRGYNFDVLTGVGALLLCVVLWRRNATEMGRAMRLVLWAWNGFGMACLLVIAGLAALTSPQVAALGQQAHHINSWVLFYPYTLLPVVLVSVALLGHVLMTAALLQHKPGR